MGLARYTVRGVAYWGVDDQVRLVDQYEAEISADVVCKECWIGKKTRSRMENNNTTEVTRPPECGAFEDVSAFRFWFDGVLVSVIAVVGFAGNLLALVVLSRDWVCLGVSLKITESKSI